MLISGTALPLAMVRSRHMDLQWVAVQKYQIVDFWHFLRIHGADSEFSCTTMRQPLRLQVRTPLLPTPAATNSTAAADPPADLANYMIPLRLS
jgi:hypothetical protein